jgi:hypothetical protein
MKISNASDLAHPKIQRKVGEAVAAKEVVSVPLATAADIRVFQSMFKSVEGTSLLAQLRSPAFANKPIVTFDPATQKVVEKAVSEALKYSPGSSSTQKTMLGVAGGAMVGGAVAAIVELTSAADHTGTTKALVTVAAAVMGAGAVILKEAKIIEGPEFSWEPGGALKLKLT